MTKLFMLQAEKSFLDGKIAIFIKDDSLALKFILYCRDCYGLKWSGGHISISPNPLHKWGNSYFYLLNGGLYNTSKLFNDLTVFELKT
jgi:hypothetical protein